MNRLAFSAFIGFWTAVVVLLAVGWLLGDEVPRPDEAALAVIGSAQLAEHDSRESCWKAIDGLVYDVTDYIPEHPTPPEVMLRWCGRESSEAWHTKNYGRPHSAMAEVRLRQMVVGRLADEEAETLAPVVGHMDFAGSASCAGCHSQVHRDFMDTLHPKMLGPAGDIHPLLLENWQVLPEQRGNPVVFDEDAPSGMAVPRDLELDDGTRLEAVAGVFVRYLGEQAFSAEFVDEAGEVLQRRSVSPYYIGERYRQVLAVNLGEGAGTRLLKYQYSFDDGAHQYTWRDRNQARIYEQQCIGCHVSGFDLAAWQRDKNQPLEAFTADLGVGCESCHGPGAAHVASPMTPGNIVSLTALSRDRQIHVCAQCHIRGTSTVHGERQDNIEFRPGDNVLDHFKPVPVKWGEGTARVAADGKAAASRQQFMDHYLGTKANLTCTHCHSMHSPDSSGALLRGDLLESCAGCHGDSYPDMQAVRHAMDGARGWEDPAWRGWWRSQHTFRMDEQDRLIGLPPEQWPQEQVWPWELPDWRWDFESSEGAP